MKTKQILDMKHLLVIIILFASVAAEAQKNNVVSAFTFRNRGQLDRAKESIDKAIVHETTKNDAKTWFYKGNIYLDLLLTENERYKNLAADPLNEAYDAYLQAIKLDEKKEYNDQIKVFLYICGENFYNHGVQKYVESEYQQAMESFEKTININYLWGVVDTVSMYNAALAAELTKDEENLKKARRYYERLAGQRYSKEGVYISLANMYREEGDTTRALRTIQRGREVSGDNLDLLIAETNIFLAMGKTEEAQENLMKALNRDPNNANLYFAIGSNYDQFANDTAKTANERAVAVVEAEKAYSKAIEINPKYFDALYNMGALFFNQGVYITDEANKNIDPSDFKGYEVEKKKADAAFEKALPYLEKAHEIEPKDINTINSLKQLYARLNMTEKFNEINKLFAPTE